MTRKYCTERALQQYTITKEKTAFSNDCSIGIYVLFLCVSNQKYLGLVSKLGMYMQLLLTSFSKQMHSKMSYGHSNPIQDCAIEIFDPSAFALCAWTLAASEPCKSHSKCQ